MSDDEEVPDMDADFAAAMMNEFKRIGYDPGERFFFLFPMPTSGAIIEFLRSVPDAAGQAGIQNAFELWSAEWRRTHLEPDD